MTAQEKEAHRGGKQWWELGWFAGLLALYLGAAAMLFRESGPQAALSVAAWFDPLFFQYNLALLLVATLSIPFIACIYTLTRRDKKERRLIREIPPEALGREREQALRARLRRDISFRGYLGGMSLMMVVITLGAAILLLLKPVFDPGALGVHYEQGANFLMLGPFIGHFPDAASQQRLLISLAAFQFGFLGAYVYFIGDLARSYFTLDLTPNTFIDGALRIITASLLALVLSFMLFEPAKQAVPPAAVQQAAPKQSSAEAFKEFLLPLPLGALPVVSFFFGFFPSRALLAVEKLAGKAMAKFLPEKAVQSIPLSLLPGMTYAGELRLGREGFDNAENLSHADPLDLAIRTSFGYGQLAQWVEQAWLAARLREDYAAFIQSTGLTGRADLARFAASERHRADPAASWAALSAGAKGVSAAKLGAIACLL